MYMWVGGFCCVGMIDVATESCAQNVRRGRAEHEGGFRKLDKPYCIQEGTNNILLRISTFSVLAYLFR